MRSIWKSLISRMLCTFTAASGTFIYALKPFSNQPKMMPAKQDTPMTTPMHANASGKALARHTMGPGLRRQ